MYEPRIPPLALCLLAWLASPAPAQDARKLQDADAARLGASFAAYFQARRAAFDVEAAEAGVVKALLDLRPTLSGADPLRFPADLGRALWLSRGYVEREVRAGAVVMDAGDSGLGYAYRVPRDYDPSTAHALILAIPHTDETPADHLRMQWTLREIQDGAILVSPVMPADPAAWTQVMAAGRPGGLSHVLTALRAALERFAVDPERVYVAGRGLGVPVALVAGNYAPQRFAGVVGRAGDAGEQGPENFSNLPTWFAGAGAEATAFQSAARAAGIDNCTLQADGKEQDLWSWVQRHARSSYPPSVTLVPGKPFPTRAYWLAVARGTSSLCHGS
jgi:hypothetical protein